MLSKEVDEGSIATPALFTLFLVVQNRLKLEANEGWSEGSMSSVELKLWILLLNDEQ